MMVCHYKTGMMSFENHRNCFSVTAFKECEAMRMNMTESNIIFLNRLTTMSSSWLAGSGSPVFPGKSASAET